MFNTVMKNCYRSAQVRNKEVTGQPDENAPCAGQRMSSSMDKATLSEATGWAFRLPKVVYFVSNVI